MTGGDATTRFDISAIIVNWNTRDLLTECLANVQAHCPPGRWLETIVVDNGSKDGSADMVARDWPQVRLIVNPHNVGYQAASNQAIRVAQGQYLLLINADALLKPSCLERMLEHMESDARVGAIGPRLVYPDDRWQRWTAGRDPSLRTATNYYFFLERIFPGVRWCEGIFLGRDVDTPFQPDWVSSACMLVRSAALHQIGPMDERFFAYMDDVDVCRRLRKAGWSIWYQPAAEAIHYMGQSTKRQTGSPSPLALRSFNRYFALTHGSTRTVILKGIEAIGFALRATAYAAAALLHPRDPRLRAQARAHWSYCKVSLEPTLGTT